MFDAATVDVVPLLLAPAGRWSRARTGALAHPRVQEKEDLFMRIAQIAPLQVSVPPHTYGGTERVIANLTDALVRLGHDVTLFATGDSVTTARLIAPRPTGINFDPTVDGTAQHLALLSEVYNQAGDFDVIHSHLDFLTLPFTRACATPTVLTLHGRLDLA